MASQVRQEESDAAFFGDLVRSETRLYNHFDGELRAAHGITTSQYEFLRFIRDHDAARSTDVATEFAVGVGAISKAMDRLEARGLVVRRPNPANRRSTILALTDEGRTLATAAERTFADRLGGLLRTAGTPEQRSVAAGVLSALRATLERDGLGTPAG